MVRAVAICLAVVVTVVWPSPGWAAEPPLEPAGEQTTAAAVTPQRALLDRYCVTCHSERLKTGGLTLETMDVSNVGGPPRSGKRSSRSCVGG